MLFIIVKRFTVRRIKENDPDIKSINTVIAKVKNKGVKIGKFCKSSPAWTIYNHNIIILKEDGKTPLAVFLKGIIEINGGILEDVATQSSAATCTPAIKTLSEITENPPFLSERF